MDAIQALTERVSCAKLQHPAPSVDQRQAIFQAALRAADHGNLRPWRFLTVEGERLADLGQLYKEAALQDSPQLNETQQQRFFAMPQRAPLVLVCIAQRQQHPKVPEIEMQMAAACAVQNMLNAAFAQSIGAYWRTGDMAYHAHVREGLAVADNEDIIGYLYLGTRQQEPKSAPLLAVDDYFQAW